MSSLEAGQSSSARQKNRLSSPSSVNEETVYQYALRVAYLAHLTQPRVPRAVSSVNNPIKPPLDLSPKRNSVAGKYKHSIENVISSHLSILDNIFNEKKSTKSNRIPKELVNILRSRLGDITSGR